MSETAKRGLTRDDLANILEQVVTTLKLNRLIMTDAFLLKLKGLIEQAKGMSDVIQRVLGLTPDQVDKLFKIGERFLEIENLLIKTDTGDHLIATLDRLRYRPVILGMIAALV